MVTLTAFLFPDTCNVYRRTAAADDAIGGKVYTYPLLTTALACRFQDEGTEMHMGRGSMLLMTETPLLFAAVAANIEEGDQIQSVLKDGTTAVAGTFTVVKKTLNRAGAGVTAADHMSLTLERFSSAA